MFSCLKNAQKFWKFQINFFGNISLHSKNSLENAVKSLLYLPKFKENFEEFQRVLITLPIISRESLLQQNFSFLYRNPEEFLQITSVFLDFLNESTNSRINPLILTSFIRFINDFLSQVDIDASFKRKIRILVLRKVKICNFQIFEKNFQGIFKELFFLSLEKKNFEKMDERMKNLYFSAFPNIIKNCEDEEICKKLITFAIFHKKRGKFLKSLISLKQWNIDDFCEIQPIEEQKNFHFRLKSCFSFWELEEYYHDNPKFLSILVNKLVKIDENIAYSIFVRNNLSKLSYNKEIAKKFAKKIESLTVIENPLISFDSFKPLEVIILEERLRNSSEESQKNEILQEIRQYLTLKDENIDEENIHFIDSCEKLEENASFLLKQELVGIDIENFLEIPVLLQISTTNKDIFLLDLAKINENIKEKNLFYTFLSNLFEGDCLKIAIGLHGDMKSMRRLGGEFERITIKNAIDLQNIFKELFPKENKSSLKFMVEKLLQKKMSKSETMGNWKKRPLRKHQLHYAALDSFVMLKLYKLLENK